MTRNTAVLERGRAVESKAGPRRVAEATGPRRRAAPDGGRGFKISEFAVALGGAGENMHRYGIHRPPLSQVAQLPMTADRRTP